MGVDIGQGLGAGRCSFCVRPLNSYFYLVNHRQYFILCIVMQCNRIQWAQIMNLPKGNFNGYLYQSSIGCWQVLFSSQTLNLLVLLSKTQPIPCIMHIYLVKRHLVGSNLDQGSRKGQWEFILVKHWVLAGALFELDFQTFTFTL